MNFKKNNYLKNFLKYSYILGLISAVSFAQNHSGSVFIPINLRHSYKSGTRSLSGLPGEKYWINRCKYKINAELQPSKSMLSGEESAIYYNESPDSIKTIVLRLYQDIFKKGNNRDWSVLPDDITDGVEIMKLNINGAAINWEKVKRSGTNLFFPLTEYLAPGDSLFLSVNWKEHIPDSHSAVRMGRYDSGAFHIAYWYPQFAVYDDISGWDTFNYGGIQEFYNDFSDFDVTITTPENYIVWATGCLQNADEVFAHKYLERYNSALHSDSIIHVITEEDLNNAQITVKKEKITYRYRAENVPDFAFSVSNHYLWDLTSMRTYPQDSARILIGAVYRKNSKSFVKYTKLAKKALQYFSRNKPAIVYPYPSLTIFNGGGSMEFPMMVNEADMENNSVAVFVTSHEISHSYFPFLTGINEQKYAWMDEAWATMLNIDFRKEEVPEIDPVEGIMQEYLKTAGTEFDIPPMIPTIVLGAGSQHKYDVYTHISYHRPAVALYFLENMIGDTLFVKALKYYITQWRGKHPLPYDFFFTFNKILERDLSWFWTPWFFDFAYPDLSLKIKMNNGRKTAALVENKGGLPLPVILTVYYENGSVKEIKKDADIWENCHRAVFKLESGQRIVKVMLGSKQIPDIDLSDNICLF